MQLKRILFLLAALLTLAACQTPPTPVPDGAETAVSTPVPIADNHDDVAPSPQPTMTQTAVPPTVPPPPTATPSPTATPIPKQLTICMANEPASLYLYGDDRPSTRNLRHALYESLVTTLDYAHQPLALEKLPTLDDGDAVLGTALARAGDKVLNANGSVVTLAIGTDVVNADGEIVTFNGDPIEMKQMRVTFRLNPLVWSDGEPVTAADSVFSFEIAADPASRSNKGRIGRTAVYEALDDRTIQWTGVPGWIDKTYALNVWQPLPEHQLGRYSAEGLLRAIEANEAPLASGAFMLDQWEHGEFIRFVKNPHYYRAAEGFPRVDTVTFKFIADADGAIAALAAQECDIAASDLFTAANAPALLEAQESGALTVQIENSLVFEQLSFNVNPPQNYAALHPSIFAETAVRQAVAHCVNRQRMSDEILYGLAAPLDGYTLADHPLLPELTTWDYDTAVGNQLLDDLGYLDADGDGIREIDEENLFQITLHTPAESASRVRMAELLADDLAACGIGVDLLPTPSSSFYTNGPEGPIFGREYDLSLFAWLLGAEPSCHLYLTDNISGEEHGWGNVNITGWSDAAFDEACNTARQSLIGSDGYNVNHREALQIYAENLPSLPLIPRLKIAATRPSVLNFALSSTQETELWNLAEIDLE